MGAVATGGVQVVCSPCHDRDEDVKAVTELNTDSMDQTMFLFDPHEDETGMHEDEHDAQLADVALQEDDRPPSPTPTRSSRRTGTADAKSLPAPIKKDSVVVISPDIPSQDQDVSRKPARKSTPWPTDSISGVDEEMGQRCTEEASETTKFPDDASRDAAKQIEDDEASQSDVQSEDEQLVFDEHTLPKNNSLMHFLTGSKRVSVAVQDSPEMRRKRSRVSLLSSAKGQEITARNSMLVKVDKKRRSSLISDMGTMMNNFNECDYTLEESLGEGSFGIAFACKRLFNGDELAVKLVDKVETAMVDIIKEAQLQYKLSHPNIVKFHDFFDEKFFACIVMDKYVGGSVMQGMHRSLKDSIKDHGLDWSSTVHIIQQMAAAVHYLHQNSVLHRDINGDNFFLSLSDILHPDCIVALGDFGLAAEVKAGERKLGTVGRKLFWAPEMTNSRNYSFPADVWALGVTIFGLTDGRFPFSDENDAAKGQWQFRCDLHCALKDLVKKMFIKEETSRINADGVIEHPWITRIDVDRCGRETMKKSVRQSKLQKKPTFKRARSDDDVSRRRKLLIERLLATPTFLRNQASDTADYIRRGRKIFSVANHANKCTTKYEWWQHSNAQKKGLLQINIPSVDALDDHWLHTVTQLLKQHQFDISKIGRGMPLQMLADEIGRGASRLMLDATQHKTLVRTVNACLVCVRTPSSRDMAGQVKVLVQKVGTIIDGTRQKKTVLPGIIKEAHENWEEAAWRLVRDVLGFGHDSLALSPTLNKPNRFELNEDEDSPFAFPGIPTVSLCSIVEFVTVKEDEYTLSRLGLLHDSPFTTKNADGIERELHWASDTEAQESTQLSQLQEESTMLVEGIDSRMVPIPLGPTLQEVKGYLSRKIDLTAAGNQKSLEDLYLETRKGVSSLVLSPSGDIIHANDVVHFHLRDKTGRILMEIEKTVGGVKTKNIRLPSMRRRTDENHFLSFWRFVGEDLALDENVVKTDADDVQLFEEETESLRLPGMRTVTRARLVKAQIRATPRATTGQASR